MIGAQCELFDGSTRAEIDSGEAVAHFSCVIASVVGVSESQLSGCIESPALDRVVVENRAVVTTAGHEAFGGSPCAEIHRAECVSHLARAIAAIVHVAEPELARIVSPPAFYSAIVENGARVP